MPFGSCNSPAVERLAEDYKLRACGRQPFVTFSFLLSFDLVLLVLFCFCCVFQDISLLFKFGKAFSYVTPNLHRPFSIVFLATLGTMCCFSLGWGRHFCLFLVIFVI